MKLLRQILILIFSLITLAPSAGICQSYHLWKWQESQCQNCPIQLATKVPELNTEKVQRFLKALQNSKFEIVTLYKSDPQEYNLLAHMAVGILGRESQFFKSWRYFAKEEMQWAVSLVKLTRSMFDEDFKPAANSRGPTQMKDVPLLIRQHYQITPDNLYVPENAARATMGFLIEALRELKQRAQNSQWEFVTKDTYADYLPYIYFGSVSKLRNRTATPEKNLYIQTMRRYMSWVAVYEFEPAVLRP